MCHITGMGKLGHHPLALYLAYEYLGQSPLLSQMLKPSGLLWTEGRLQEEGNSQ